MRKALTGLAITLALAGCGDPLDKVEHIGDVELADDQATAAALPSPEELAREGGIFAGLFKAKDTAAPEEVPAENMSAEDGSGDEPPIAETEAQAAEAETTQAASAVEPEKRRGVFGLFRAGSATQDNADQAQVQTASLSSEVPEAAPQARVSPEKRHGLFGGGRASGPDQMDVPLGAVLPYGTIARVCDANPKQLGTRIDKAPVRGNGFTLYDSDPQSTSARTFYVTGFSDGCPRQFTAALAMFGAPSMHEQLRYGQPSDEYPYSDTDKAYEKVKSQVCRVGKRKPCGSAISRLEQDTVFISTYEHFGNNARWSDILLHDGQVMAAAIKTP
ncbi:hypothetical protein JQX22_18750 [Sulfitobacter pseudonitzschiae]|uniref:Uncharacterized protein n=1 Tax=Pseudosulfitobacter pseudonitzschiae TaxID=1402135 RepID=A0A9Q2RWH4_9RHOB|nr:hypothetical protein [Pseudosulfitobacter pseudonitzschiae]MBM2293976.1 hypothetical protein [Pseudosulfitobacter pseudonitzschiae]MBM2298877.1 hypothetical protein [Pseudosulfitobacter pseudonitzschiae]MBM2313590.1 hypothetical protein [Pseudosulfitobacter pseudonitzschiae]MBM2328071.1 hypothetical protein [Pseudosulfitobacter pseudonitzschiae]MBM2337655.1 hypothetical protein [Pseudosulfitobacter pseudonitzschiae]